MGIWFANISVNMKLAMGFGGVLTLTAILAATGWTSLRSLIVRSDRMADISELNNLLNKLRLANLQYRMSNGDDAKAQEMQTALDGFTRQQQKLKQFFMTPQNVDKLKQTGVLISAYQKTLSQMRTAYKTKDAQNQALISTAGKSIELITAIKAAAVIEETAASSVELARLGNQLQMLVSHFPV